jgi:hypothetical protein
MLGKLTLFLQVTTPGGTGLSMLFFLEMQNIQTKHNILPKN